MSVADSRRVSVWMTGDTVLTRSLLTVTRGLDVDVLLLHLGSVQFPITGPLRYSMNGRDATKLLALLRPRVAIPVHYEGWSHFSEGQAHLRAELDTLADVLSDVVTWLEPGIPQEL